jgi:predicted RNA methylase
MSAAVMDAPTVNADARDNQEQADQFSNYTATYSAEDNKLRLYSVHRLDTDLYKRVRDAGFIWAPKQQLFVAPMWTPSRADLLLELCGEICDEHTSLADRAAERAERFTNYQGKRAHEAAAARAGVEAIAGNIPFGQPILVGHHSERRARKDAERIENGMRKAVDRWETSEYWKGRAAGALRHADYKADPGTRHRRIKGIKADKRKQEKIIEESALLLKFWNTDGLTMAQAQAIAGRDRISCRFPLDKFPRTPPASQYEGDSSLYSGLVDGIINQDQAREIALRVHARRTAWATRWLNHYTNRIVYETAMLGETGDIAAAKFDIQPGGQILARGKWATVVRTNKADGAINSVTTNARGYGRVVPIEEVSDYTAPTEATIATAKAASKLPPLCNYPSDGCVQMTAADYKRKVAHGYGFTRLTKATDTVAVHRRRMEYGAGCSLSPVFLTDSKRTDPPALAATTPAPAADAIPTPAPPVPVAPPRQNHKAAEPNVFDQMRAQLRQGVQVVSADQLFPTPQAEADYMVELANLQPGMRVADPEAGTGAILTAVRRAHGEAVACVGVEINAKLANHLRQIIVGAEIYNRDFMECGDELGLFDAILMNPPFARAQDIDHIMHAMHFLKAGGVLVAICADGPRQAQLLRPMIEQNGGTWKRLPDGTFQESGTMVCTAMLTYRRPH